MLASASKILLSITLIGTLVFAFAPGNWTPAWVVNHDKFSHLGVFFILAFILKFSFPQKHIFMQISLLIAFAFAIELMQYLFFNRDFSRIDIVYDLMGIGLFIVVEWILPYLSKWLSFKKSTESLNNKVKCDKEANE